MIFARHSVARHDLPDRRLPAGFMIMSRLEAGGPEEHERRAIQQRLRSGADGKERRDAGGRSNGSAPGEIDQAHRHRPAAQRGEVGEVVGGIDDEAEQCSVKGRRKPRSRQRHREDDDAAGVDEIEQDRHRPVRLIEQKLAQPRLVEIAADEAQPQRVEDGEGRQGGEVADEQRLHRPSLAGAPTAERGIAKPAPAPRWRRRTRPQEWSKCGR